MPKIVASSETLGTTWLHHVPLPRLYWISNRGSRRSPKMGIPARSSCRDYLKRRPKKENHSGTKTRTQTSCGRRQRNDRQVVTERPTETESANEAKQKGQQTNKLKNAKLHHPCGRGRGSTAKPHTCSETTLRMWVMSWNCMSSSFAETWAALQGIDALLLQSTHWTLSEPRCSYGYNIIPSPELNRAGGGLLYNAHKDIVLQLPPQLPGCDTGQTSSCSMSSLEDTGGLDQHVSISNGFNQNPQ